MLLYGSTALVGLDRLVIEIFDHDQTLHTQLDSAGQVIVPLQRPRLTTHITCKRQTSMTLSRSNPQFQQSSGRRPSPQTARHRDWPEVCLLPAQQPPLGQGLLIIEVSRSHTTTHHSRQDSSGRVISSSQRPLPDNTQPSQHTDIHAPGGIRTHSLSRRAAADLGLRPRGTAIGPKYVGEVK